MAISSDPSSSPRQRLLYMYAKTPSVYSELLGLTQIEPVAGHQVGVEATVPEWPYDTIHEALVDAWQIVQFPSHQAPFDDADLDVVGYEFILQKIEVVE